MLQETKNGIPLFRFKGLPENDRLQHAIFTRHGGVSAAPFASLNLSISVPDDEESVYTNRHRVYSLYGRDTETVVHAYLVHGADVARVTQVDNGTWVERVDGIITNEPGCALTMNYADCAPIFLYDPVHHAIGLGHAGWQGAVKDLPGELVRAMQREFKSDPAKLIAGIGPCIGPCCYEVGEPVIGLVRQRFGKTENLLVAPSHHTQSSANGTRPHFNLPEANRRNLVQAGVEHVEQADFCTACRTDIFFSHRAEKGLTGRFGTIFILG